MGLIRALPWLVLAACGRFGFGPQPDQPQPDAAPAAPDSAIDGPTATTAGLIAYWTMDDASSVSDMFGGNTATCASGSCPKAATGIIGGALAFDGAKSCLTVPSLAGWADATFTISAWVLSPGMSGPVVVHESMSGCPSPALRMSNGAGLVQLNITDSTPHNEAWTPTIANTSQWHQIAAAWDGAKQWLYVDGACVCSEAQAKGPLDNTQPFTIGCYPTDSPAASYFTGTIDEVRIYNRVLAADEIGVLYEVGGGAAPAPAPCTATCATAAP